MFKLKRRLKMFFGDCEICTTKEAKFIDRKPAINMKLFGGFQTTLCSECSNAWHEYIIARSEYVDEFAARVDNEAIQVRANSEPRSLERSAFFAAEVVRLNNLAKELRDKAYFVAKAWVEERRAAVVAKAESI